MAAPLLVSKERDLAWPANGGRRRRYRTDTSAEVRSRGRGRLLLAYFLVLWLIEPEAMGTLVTDLADSIVGHFSDVVVAASDEMVEATDQVLALKLILDKFRR